MESLRCRLRHGAVLGVKGLLQALRNPLTPLIAWLQGQVTFGITLVRRLSLMEVVLCVLPFAKS